MRELLLSIRKRPGMYLYPMNFSALCSLIYGFSASSKLHNSSLTLIPDKFQLKFNHFYAYLNEKNWLDKEEGVFYFFEELDKYLDKYHIPKIKEIVSTYSDFLKYLRRYLYLRELYLSELNKIFKIPIECINFSCFSCYLDIQEEINHFILRKNIHCFFHGTDICFSSYLKDCKEDIPIFYEALLEVQKHHTFLSIERKAL